jgi:hypothetical protein
VSFLLPDPEPLPEPVALPVVAFRLPPSLAADPPGVIELEQLVISPAATTAASDPASILFMR